MLISGLAAVRRGHEVGRGGEACSRMRRSKRVQQHFAEEGELEIVRELGLSVR